MGLLGHRKTWHYALNASPNECLDAFQTVFSKKGGPMLMRGKWHVSRSNNGAVATYGGRGGVVGGMSMMSKMATAEEGSAEGSQVSFEIGGQQGGRLECTMWLSTSGSRLGLTPDARFIRPYMNRVEGALRTLDPTLQATTS
jgi:hypothetical protein